MTQPSSRNRQGKLRVATCQFATTADPGRNGRMIRRQMQQAKRRRAEIVHFSECALSGYGGSEIKSWKNYPWDRLRRETELIMAEARRLKLWTVLGSTHPLAAGLRPHNSLYVINPAGRIVDRYDKRCLTVSDLNYYSAGDHWTTFKVNGVSCAVLICFEVRFPEIYRELKRRGAQLILQSFYNAGLARPRENVHAQIMRQSAQAQCGFNYLWMSLNNSSAWYSLYPSAFIRPDGVIQGRLPQNRAGLMVNEVNVNRDFYDATARFRRCVMNGQLHTGRQVRHPRSRNRTEL